MVDSEEEQDKMRKYQRGKILHQWMALNTEVRVSWNAEIDKNYLKESGYNARYIQRFNELLSETKNLYPDDTVFKKFNNSKPYDRKDFDFIESYIVDGSCNHIITLQNLKCDINSIIANIQFEDDWKTIEQLQEMVKELEERVSFLSKVR